MGGQSVSNCGTAKEDRLEIGHWIGMTRLTFAEPQ